MGLFTTDGRPYDAHVGSSSQPLFVDPEGCYVPRLVGSFGAVGVSAELPGTFTSKVLAGGASVSTAAMGARCFHGDGIVEVEGCWNGPCVDTVVAVVEASHLTGVGVHASGPLVWGPTNAQVVVGCVDATATARLKAGNFDATRVAEFRVALPPPSISIVGARDPATGRVCFSFFKSLGGDVPPTGTQKLVASFYGTEGNTNVELVTK
jgi:hypothetical protein